MKKRLLLLSTVAISLLVLLPAPTALAYSETFDGYAPFMLAEALTTPGVIYDGGGVWFILDNTGFGVYALGNSVRLYDYQHVPLTMTFAAPQSRVQFVFATGEEGAITVTGSLGGTDVFSDTVASAALGGKWYEGTVVINTRVDEVTVQVLGGIDLSIDNLSTSETAAEAEALPGCDVLLPIPATAVGGTFVADAPVYWAPGKLTNPLVTIAAGNSARVIGLDSTGEYYQIIWVCDYVWVPRASLGPNYDAVWNGAPLPTAVVE